MNTSQELKNIYTAIIRARPEIAPIARTKSARNYKYATLDSVIELLSLVLPKHGLGWVQALSTEEGRPVLVTRIIHESGEWIEDALALPQTKLAGGANESQELGASITYFKRYALSAMFGIATDDDTDGVADVRNRKEQVKAQARAAGHDKRESAADTGDISPEQVIFTPTPAKPLPPVTEIIPTGDAAIDAEIRRMYETIYKGVRLFTDRTAAWLNSEIKKKTPQEALASANRAAQKRMNDIDKEQAA